MGVSGSAPGGLANLVEDNSPQLGGALDTNSHSITFASVAVSDVVDEDDLSSNSATKLATQQSTKAYVDTGLSTKGTPVTISEAQVFNGSAPTSYTDLDLSGTVGSNLAIVLLKIKNTDNADHYTFRQNGDSDTYQVGDSGTHDINMGSGNSGLLLVYTDASGILEWTTTDGDDVTIYIEAYWRV